MWYNFKGVIFSKGYTFKIISLRLSMKDKPFFTVQKSTSKLPNLYFYTKAAITENFPNLYKYNDQCF